MSEYSKKLSQDNLDQYQDTQLHNAARSGDLEACIKALHLKIPVDTLGFGGVTALMLAASNKHVDIVKYLLMSGANPNIKSNATLQTALHCVAQAAHSDPDKDESYEVIIEMLLKCGAEKNIRDKNGLIPRDLAPVYLDFLFAKDIDGDNKFPMPIFDTEAMKTQLLKIEKKNEDVWKVAMTWPPLDSYSETSIGGSLVEAMDEATSNATSYFKLSSNKIGTFLTRQLESQLSSFLALNTGPCCVLVRSDWLHDFEPGILQALKTRLTVNFRTKILDVPLYEKLHTSNINPSASGKLIKACRKEIVDALGRGMAVVMTAATTQPLDKFIKEFVTLDLQVPRFNRERVAHACEDFFPPHEDWNIPDERWVSFVAPQDFLVIANTLSIEASVEEIITSLKTQVTRRLNATIPERGSLKIDQIQGMEAAKTWAKHLASDIRGAMEGKIAWANVDRGALLEGASGVGKTALARALASELGLPMIATTASSWQAGGYLSDMLRAMEKDFSAAAEVSPSILFIDELDAVGSRTNGGSHDQWVTWGVNHLLALMDGFNSNQQVIVLGATNHANKIDPALRRSGRLDRTINVPLPSRKALASMYEHYIGKNEHTLSLEDINALAGSSVGLSGADVERIIREARRTSRVANRNLTKADILKSIYATPPEDQRQPMTEEEIREIAYHEAGHALMMWLSDDKGERVQYLSVVPRADGSLGFVAQAPSEKKHTLSAKTGKQRLATMLGGRAAEQVAFGAENVSSGSSSDLRAATETANFMVNRCGLGPSGTLSVSEKSDEKRDAQIEQLLQDAYQAAVSSLTQHKKLLDLVADALIEKSELSGAEFLELANSYASTKAS